MRGRGGIFGFSILEIAVILFAVVNNRFIFKVLGRAIRGDFGSDGGLIGSIFGGSIFDSSTSKEQQEIKSQVVTEKEWLRVYNSRDKTKLSADEFAYYNIAIYLKGEMKAMYPSWEKVYNTLKPLNRDELITVFNDFGQEGYKTWGIFTRLEEDANLILWLAEFYPLHVEKLRTEIFAKTGLWR